MPGRLGPRIGSPGLEEPLGDHRGDDGKQPGCEGEDDSVDSLIESVEAINETTFEFVDAVGQIPFDVVDTVSETPFDVVDTVGEGVDAVREPIEVSAGGKIIKLVCREMRHQSVRSFCSESFAQPIVEVVAA